MKNKKPATVLDGVDRYLLLAAADQNVKSKDLLKWWKDKVGKSNVAFRTQHGAVRWFAYHRLGDGILGNPTHT